MPNLEKTIATLAKSRNEAATEALIAALDGPSRETFGGSVRALIERRAKAGHQAVISRWHAMNEEERRSFANGRGRMAVALRESLLSDDDQLFANATEIVEAIDEFDVMPTLVTMAEQADPRRSDPALRVALHLTARLAKMTQADRDARDQQNTDLIQQCVLECLERSVERFRQHKRIELIEAFVGLAGPASPSLRQILESPHHPCFATVVEILGRSTSPEVVSLLASLLLQVDAPPIVRTVAGKRIDAAFQRALLETPLAQATKDQWKALARVKSLACFEIAHVDCVRLTGVDQAAAMRLLSATSVPDEQKLDLAQRLLEAGEPVARLAACHALAPIAGQRSNELVMRALADREADVQIAAAQQIRSRHIPGSMAKLVELAASPVPEVQNAAREALPEFSVENYLAQFEGLTEDQRRSNGALVVRVDRSALGRLKEELENPSPRRRLRAAQALDRTGLSPQAADRLVERLQDEDHMVRGAAAEALQTCTGLDVRNALVAALEDRSSTVQTAARASLEAIDARGQALRMTR